jgi:hypothetical protein
MICIERRQVPRVVDTVECGMATKEYVSKELVVLVLPLLPHRRDGGDPLIGILKQARVTPLKVAQQRLDALI